MENLSLFEFIMLWLRRWREIKTAVTQMNQARRMTRMKNKKQLCLFVTCPTVVTVRKPSRPHVAVPHMDGAWPCARSQGAESCSQKHWGPRGWIWRRKMVNHIKLWDNRVKGWTFAWGLKAACPPCCWGTTLEQHTRAWVYLQWKSSFILPWLRRIPVRKHWPQERRDQVL